MKVRWLFFALLAFVTWSARPVAAAETDITLHKRVYRDARLVGAESWAYANDGKQLQLGDDSLGLNGAHFTVYAADGLYAAAKRDGESETDFAKRLAKTDMQTAIELANTHNLPVIQTLTTATVAGEDGVAAVTVPSRGAYLLVETGVDAEMDIDMHKASPLYLKLPVVVDAQYLDAVHLYPKNVGYVRDPFFFKFGVQLNGDERRLAGVVFALYKLAANGDKLYLDLGQTDLANRWVTSDTPLVDNNVERFVSDANGLVDTGARFLPAGTYYFEELQPLAGYTNNLAEQPVKVEVPTSWYDANGNFSPVLVNGEAMPETLSGIVQPETIAAGRPRVYNYQLTTTTPEGGNTTKPTGTLPTMASALNWVLVGLGLILMGLAYRVVRQRR